MQICARVAALVEEAAGQGLVPLVLGGDHSIAMGTLGGMAKARGAGAALWIDAHGDLNRPSTSPTGNVHGMPLAAALGAGGDWFATDAYPTPSVARAALVGIRSLDPGERRLIGELDVRVYTMSEIDKRGLRVVLTEALEFLAGSPFCTSASTSTRSTRCSRRCRHTGQRRSSYREQPSAESLPSRAADSLDVVEVNPLDRANATATLLSSSSRARSARIL
jgi:arginase